MSYVGIVALVLLGALALIGLSAWLRAESALRGERRRTETYRRSLESAAAIASGARNVRCPTCSANWSSVHAHCEAGLAGGGAGASGGPGRDPA